MGYSPIFLGLPFTFGIFSYAFGLGFLFPFLLPWRFVQEAVRPLVKDGLEADCLASSPFRLWSCAWPPESRQSTSLSLSDSEELDVESSDSELLSPTGRVLW
jgi:hypothetical protein